MSLNKNLIYILFGVFFEKALPFILTFFFVQYINDEEFGLWVLYFQFVLIFTSTITSPLMLFFNREFKSSSNENINIYNFHLIIIYLLIFILISYLYDINFINSFLSLITIITFILNNIIFNYLRFKKHNFKYFIFSLLRFLLFIIFLLYVKYNYVTIEIHHIFLAYILGNSFIIILYKNILVLKNKNYKTIEFIRLSIYGLLTLLLGGIDKLVLLNTSLNLKDLAVLGYALIFANSTSLIVEALKKYFSPIYFKDFNDLGYYSSKTLKKTINTNIILGIIQILFPFSLFLLIDFFSLTKLSLITPDFFYLLLLLCVSLLIHNIYHFINPYLFFINKSHYLSLVIFLVSLLFILIVVNIQGLNLIFLSYIKIFSSVVLISLCYILIINLKPHNNV